jgi:UDP-N-acetylglucosamine acyltransferase
MQPDGAEIYDGGVIHHSAVIYDNVHIVGGVTIGPHAVIGWPSGTGKVMIGGGTYIGAGAVIGSPGEIRGNGLKVNGDIIIGRNCEIREQVTIQASATGNVMMIDEDCMLMSKSHLGHDVCLGKNVTIATGAKIGGFTRIDDFVNVGLNAVVHQRLHIGMFAMIGMGAVVTKNVFPGTVAAGNPATVLKFNSYGMEKNGFTAGEDFSEDDFLSVFLSKKTIKNEGYIRMAMIDFRDKHNGDWICNGAIK